jgi:phosphonate transport system permease protein
MIASLLSLVLPGAGQAYAGQWYRGAAVLLGVLLALAAALWYGVTGWFAVPALMWLWNVRDAAILAAGRRQAVFPFVAALLFLGYGIGWQVTHIDLGALTGNAHRAVSIIGPMLHPDFLVRARIQQSAWAPVEVPCGPQPPPATNSLGDVRVSIAPDCAGIGAALTVRASGLWPDTPTRIEWATPIGNRLPLGPGYTTPLFATSDSSGRLSAVVHVPPDALAAAPNPDLPLEHRVYMTQSHPQPGFRLSTNGTYVLKGIVETLFLALMATTFGALGAIPLAFLAARNLMGRNPVTLAIYVMTRTVLNVVRSIEALIIAIVFVAIVGLGPFAGVIAITLHTVAALGKLYSEVIEGIDPGPLEAVRATGGTWAQVVRYAVIPQIVPSFASFTLFRWDINVRTSTIIGFVGGGGIGFFLYQWIIKGDYRAAGSSFIAIAVIVTTLDVVSARIRARLV